MPLSRPEIPKKICKIDFYCNWRCINKAESTTDWIIKLQSTNHRQIPGERIGKSL